MCKYTADKLLIPWPNAVEETTRTCYKVKRLPKAKWPARQFLPIPPECLEEVTPGDCVDMEGLGLAPLSNPWWLSIYTTARSPP